MKVLRLLAKKWVYISIVFILLLGYQLRASNLYTWPRLGATFDEYAWTWIGLSIIQNHIPTSWSPHPQYKQAKDIIYQKTHFRLVTPYLEHPPLFGLIAGSYALIDGAKDMYHVDLQHIRGLALILGLLSIFFVFLYAKEVYDTKVGILSALFYAIIPSIAVGSRLVQNENFFIPGFLLTLYFALKYIKTKKLLFRNLSAIFCGLLILAKIPWATATLAVVMLYAADKRYKDAILILFSGLLGLAIFMAYGFSFDAKLFISLWQLQLNRYDIGFDSMFALFTSPILTDRNYLDGWIYGGWFAIGLLVQDIKKHLWIILPFLAYFAIFVYAIPNEPGHGWYRYPFFPFLTIALAYVINQYFNKNYFITFFFFVLTGLSMFQQTWVQLFGFSFLIFRAYLVLSGLTILPFFFPKTKPFGKFLSYGIMGVIILLSVLASYSYNEQ